MQTHDLIQRMEMLQTLKEKRLEFRRSRRTTMFSADVAFISISMPLLVGRSIRGLPCLFVIASLVLALFCLLSLAILLHADERELREVEDKIIQSDGNANYVGATSTRIETVCKTVWGYLFVLAFCCMFVAVILTMADVIK